MNGNEAINLTTEPNIICKGDWKKLPKAVCPKEIPRPLPQPCCSKVCAFVSVKPLSLNSPPYSSNSSLSQDKKPVTTTVSPDEDYVVNEGSGESDVSHYDTEIYQSRSISRPLL